VSFEQSILNIKEALNFEIEYAEFANFLSKPNGNCNPNHNPKPDPHPNPNLYLTLILTLAK